MPRLRPITGAVNFERDPSLVAYSNFSANTAIGKTRDYVTPRFIVYLAVTEAIDSIIDYMIVYSLYGEYTIYTETLYNLTFGIRIMMLK